MASPPPPPHHLPDDFKCPISLEVMSDPVILSSGHTFDRPSIQRWLDSGHRTCPITNLPLPQHPSLIPNHALRSLISNYSQIPLPKSPIPKSQSPQTLISNLTSRSSPNKKLESLSHLAKLTKSSPSLRRLVTESGAVSSILYCVDSPISPPLLEKALSLLLNLSLDDDSKVGLVAEGAIGRVIRVLQSGTPDCRAIGCTILTSLAVVEVNKATIGDYPNAIRSLVNLLEVGKGREVKEAATALYAICSFPDNRRKAVECGAVPVLVRLVGNGMERAVEVLSCLVKCKEGRVEMGKVLGFVDVLVKVVCGGRSTGKGVQCALFTLNSLCFYDEEARDEARRLGVVEVCVGLGEDENDKVRRTAECLIQTLSGLER
ncbi:U-box domain-containing protein 8 [Linum grandiflorum]